ncbi:MAG: hypothetical protein ACI89D_000016 [Bermanella sp.]|jgi:hypothetical protein
MEQLAGIDASFLYMEQPHAPMHIGGFSLFDQTGVSGGKVRFKGISLVMLRRKAVIRWPLWRIRVIVCCKSSRRHRPVSSMWRRQG